MHKKNYEIRESEYDDSINLKLISQALIRNKKIILIFTSISIIMSVIFAYSQRKIYQGQFKIVVSDQLESPLSNSASLLNRQFGISLGKSSKILTQIEILKSPSVLIDIFNFIKSEKDKANDKKFKDIRFEEWKEKYLSIERVKDTNVLKLSYEDYDKNIIIPVLNKISDAYQKRSGIKRLKSIEFGIDTMNNQIEVFKTKSVESLEKIQKYAIEQDLEFDPTKLFSSTNGNLGLVDPSSPINSKMINLTLKEQTRVKAANQLRLIDELLTLYDESKNDKSLLNNIASKIDSDNETLNKLSLNLNKIDQDIAQLSSLYKEEDVLVKSYKKQREAFLKFYSEQVYNSLLARKKATKVLIKAFDRPKGVVFKYNDLLTKAARDQNTLNNLENQLVFLSIEQASKKSPWELITKPTLYSSPVAPQKKRIAFMGIVFGLIAGSIVSLIKEKKENIIYSSSEIDYFSNLPVFFELTSKYQIEEFFSLLSKGLLSDNSENIALISPVEIMDNEKNLIYQGFKKNFKEREILITDDLRKTNKSINLFLLIKLGFTKKSELESLYSKILLQKSSLLGILILKDLNND